MADDDTDSDPLYGTMTQVANEPADVQQHADVAQEADPAPGRPPRAQLYKSPTGEPGAAYYQEEREKAYMESKNAAKEFNDAITPYRDHVLEVLKQKPPAQPQLIGPGSQTDPQKAMALLATSMPFLAIGSKHLRDVIGAAVAGVGMPWRLGRHAREREAIEYNNALDAIKTYNETQIRQYKDTLENRKLELEDTFKILKEIATEHRDAMMLKAINDKNLPGIIKTLENHENAEAKRAQAADNWNLDQQKAWLKDKDNMEYATIVQNRYGIDLTEPDPKKFKENRKLANTKYSYEQFMEDKQAKLPEKQIAPGDSTHRFEPQRAEEQQKTDPMGLRSNQPASDDEKKKFQEEINSSMGSSNTQKPADESSGKDEKKKHRKHSADDPLGPSEGEENLQRQMQKPSGINVPPLRTNQPDNPLLYTQ